MMASISGSLRLLGGLEGLDGGLGGRAGGLAGLCGGLLSGLSDVLQGLSENLTEGLSEPLEAAFSGTFDEDFSLDAERLGGLLCEDLVAGTAGRVPIAFDEGPSSSSLFSSQSYSLMSELEASSSSLNSVTKKDNCPVENVWF
jgi:hypothetical protein